MFVSVRFHWELRNDIIEVVFTMAFNNKQRSATDLITILKIFSSHHKLPIINIGAPEFNPGLGLVLLDD